MWVLEAWLGCIRPGACVSPPRRGPDSRLPLPGWQEKKASIGYTYEDSTVAEVEKVTEKPEEEESPAEEESNSDEDEVIPDIGKSLLPLPIHSPRAALLSRPPCVGRLCLRQLRLLPPASHCPSVSLVSSSGPASSLFLLPRF